MILPVSFYPLVVGFLGSFRSPTTLVTNLCVPPGQLIQLSKYLAIHHPLLIRHLQSLSELNEENEHHVLVILNLSCKDIEAQLRQKTTLRHLNFNYRWLLVHTEDIYETEERAIDIFAEIGILHASEIYLCHFQIDHDMVEIKRMYRNSVSSTLILEPIYEAPLRNFSAITWTRRDPSLVASRLLPPGLDGSLIRATMAIPHNDSLNHLWDYQDRHIDTITKVGFLLTNVMISYLNASAVFKPTPAWGYLNETTGKWDGMTGELLRNDADIAATPWFCNLLRMPTIQYISMASPSKIMFLFQSPKLTMTDNVFLLPFHWVSKARFAQIG